MLTEQQPVAFEPLELDTSIDMMGCWLRPTEDMEESMEKEWDMASVNLLMR